MKNIITLITSCFLASMLFAQLPNINYVGQIASTNSGFELVYDMERIPGTNDYAVLGGFTGNSVNFMMDNGSTVTSSAGNTTDLFIGKMNSSGAFYWVNFMPTTQGNISGSAVAADLNGNIYVSAIVDVSSIVDIIPGPAQSFVTTATNDVKLVISKLNSSGVSQWGQVMNAGSASAIYDIDVSSDGYLYAVGAFNGQISYNGGQETATGVTQDGFVAKLGTGGGSFNLFRAFASLGQNQVRTIKAADDGYYIGGTYGQTVNFDFYGSNTITNATFGVSFPFMAKYSYNLEALEWVVPFISNGNSRINDIEIDQNGDLVAVGIFKDFISSPNLPATLTNSDVNPTTSFVWKFDPNGTNIWSKYIDVNNPTANSLHEIKGVSIDASGNIYCAGNYDVPGNDFDPGAGTASLSNSGLRDIFVWKLNSLGNYEYVYKLGSSGDDGAYGIQHLPSGGEFYVFGYYSNSIDFDPGASNFDQFSSGTLDGFFAKYGTCGLTAPNFVTLTAPNGNSICGSGTVDLFISNAQTNTEYTWSNGNSFVSQNNPTLTVGSAGNYQVLSNNCAGPNSSNAISVIVSNNSTSTISPSICSGTYTAPDGQNYSTAGTYTAVISNSAGCDSTITINLSSGTPTSSTVSESICPGFLYTAPDGQTYSQAGNYTATIQNAAGCDSTITINLSVLTVTLNDDIVVNGGTLSAVESNATYQWVSCPSFQSIAGETNQTFTPTVSGDYAVWLFDQQGCSTISLCEFVGVLDITAYNQNEIKIYPNPTSSNIHIQLETASSLHIFSAEGKIVATLSGASTYNYDASHLESGVYFIQAENGGVHKFIKQ